MSGIVSRRGNNVHRNITVTPFLNKLYSMVDDRASDELIRWTADGNSFMVLRHEDFAKEVLPRFFKHSNFSSFVRQLNMYGFHKVPHLQQGGLIADGPGAESWEFNNENFQRGQPDLMHFIRRKKGSRDGAAAGQDGADDDDAVETEGEGGRDNDDAADGAGQTARSAEANGARPARPARASRAPPANLAKILKEIQVIRDHQLTISTDIKRLQEENQSLWMQASATEERYNKHQQTIDKILRFLATVFSADARHSEIQPPLRRLISHNAKSAGGRSDAAQASWTQNVFEDMDFPDVLGDERPPDKRQRTGKSAQPGSIYELPSGTPPPSGPSPQRNVSGGSSSVAEGRTVRRKTSNPQQSTALTRTQPRPRFNAAPPQMLSTATDNSDDNSALVASPGSPYTSRLKKNTKSIEQLQQEIDSLGSNLESLTRQLQSGMLSHTLAAPLPPAGYPAGAAAPSQSMAYAPPSSTNSDYSALFTPGTLEGLEASLIDPGLSMADHSMSGSSMAPAAAGDPSVASLLGAGNALQSAMTTNPTGGTTGADAFDSNALQDMLRACTPEQYDGLMNYFRLINNPVNTHLLTDGHSTETPPANATPFLDFVDPSAGSTPAGTGADDAAQESEISQFLFNALSGVGASAAPAIDEELAASFLQAVSSATTGDGLTAAPSGLTAEAKQQNNT
ncbi:Heat shock transcription factor [Coemansia sp. RSA 2618]|nr:Heat shock transcription factor [Coemansia sp. RSA 2618]